jgi:hypothetical protein
MSGSTKTLYLAQAGLGNLGAYETREAATAALDRYCGEYATLNPTLGFSVSAPDPDGARWLLRNGVVFGGRAEVIEIQARPSRRRPTQRLYGRQS